ncbi:hypothetical protein Hdeb2414_s0011g00359841 [Helianthus debilis subsp. tardiflorus]
MRQRFDFVAFSKVADSLDLESRLRSIKVGDNKLFISIAKFVDGAFMGNNKNPEKQSVIGKEIPKHYENEDRKVQKTGNRGGIEHCVGMSFRDTLLKNVPNQEADTVILAPNINAFPQWHDKAVVGRVLEFQKLVSLKKWLQERGYSEVMIKYIGGFMAILVFGSAEETVMFKKNEEVWKECFSKIDIWKGQMLAFERIAWLKIFGVPLKLAINLVFNGIGGRFGVVVQTAQVSKEDDDFSYVCIGVLSGEGGRIKPSLTPKWQDKSIRVWVEEEQREWMPDCLEEEIEDEARYFNNDSSVNMDENHVDNRKEDDAGDNSGEKSGENSQTDGENNTDAQNKETNVGLESINVDNNGNKNHTVNGGNILGVDQSKNNFFCYTFVNKSDTGEVIRPKKF